MHNVFQRIVFLDFSGYTGCTNGRTVLKLTLDLEQLYIVNKFILPKYYELFHQRYASYTSA